MWVHKYLSDLLHMQLPQEFMEFYQLSTVVGAGTSPHQFHRVPFHAALNLVQSRQVILREVRMYVVVKP